MFIVYFLIFSETFSNVWYCLYGITNDDNDEVYSPERQCKYNTNISLLESKNTRKNTKEWKNDS